jgi:hypothetical protein
MHAHSCGSDTEEIYERWRRRRRGSFKVSAGGGALLSCGPFKGSPVVAQDELRLVVTAGHGHADAVDPAATVNNGQQELLLRLPVPAATGGGSGSIRRRRRRPGKAPAVGVKRRRAAGPCIYICHGSKDKQIFAHLDRVA